MRNKFLVGAIVLSLLGTVSAWAGTIEGKVQVKGEWKVTKKEKLDLWIKAKESLVVNAANRGLKNAVVYIKEAKGKFNPPERPMVLDQKEKTFVPRVIPILKGTKVKITTSDDFRHTVASKDEFKCIEKRFFGKKLEPAGGKTIEGVKKEHAIYFQTWVKGESEVLSFEKSPCIISLFCDEHIRMQAYILVLDNPYFAVTDGDGKYKIDGIPPGEYELVVWHEALGEKRGKAKVTDGKVEVNLELEGKTI